MTAAADNDNNVLLCPITFAPVGDIKYPVAFHAFPHQPYECEALARWLLVRNINPMTNSPVFWKKTPLEIIGPHALCQTPARVQAYLESTLGYYYYEHETIMQYFAPRLPDFALYLMVMLCALLTSLAYRFGC